MIIVVNGVYKTQSTLIYLIFLNLFNQKNKLNGLEDFLDLNQEFNLNIYENYENIKAIINEPYVAKIHSFKVDFLKKLPKKFTITTDRNNLDIINSHYHHYINEKQNVGFYEYFLKIGFIKLIEIEIYKFYAKKFSSMVINYTKDKSILCSEIFKFLRGAELSHKFSIQDIEQAYDKSYIKDGSSEFMGKKRPWFNNRKSIRSKSRLVIVRTSEMIIGFLIIIPFIRAALRWFLAFLPGRNRGRL